MDYSQILPGVRDSLTDLIVWLQLQQPRLLGAAALLVFGWLLAILMRMLTSRIVHALGRLVPRQLLRRELPQAPIERQVSDLIGLVVFWGVLLFFLAAAAETLGLSVLSTSLAGLGFYVPRLLGAILIAVFGLILGNLSRDAVTAAAGAAGAPFAAAVGQIARAAVLIAAALIAVAELGIDITLLTALLSVTLLAVLGAFALAFGLGARTAVSNIIGAHYLRQTFEVGHQIRCGETTGTIAAITTTAVVIRSADAEVVVPAKHFSEAVTTLLLPGALR